MNTIDLIQKLLSIVQTATIICAAVIAAIKFKVFRLWRESQRAEMECSVLLTASKDIVFEAKYHIFNTGDRPLRVGRVVMNLCPAKQVNGAHLIPDLENLLVSPTVIAEDEKQAGQKDHFKPIGSLGFVNRGGYSTFTLRCRLKELPEVVFVTGEFSWREGTKTFARMHVNEIASHAPLPQQAASGAVAS